MAVFGLHILMAIPTSIYFLTVYVVRKKAAYQRAQQRALRIQRAEEAKCLKW